MRLSRPRARLALAAGLTVLLLACGIVTAWLLTRVPLVETVNKLGAIERCTSCHPGGALRAGSKPHPRVPGHATLSTLGCTACHGGKPLELSDAAHGPPLGGAPDPFLPRTQMQLACARCHVPGLLKGAERLNRGATLYLEASCASCHQPGGHPRRFGLDLRLMPSRDPAFLRRHLLEPRVSNPQATMWSLRDDTYRGRFSDDAAGRRNLEDLVVYTLALSDRWQRQRWAAAWHRSKLRIDRPCSACHETPRAGATPHRCPELASNGVLRCQRCHRGGGMRRVDAAAACPQVRGALFRCETCHLREGDGARELLEQALSPATLSPAPLSPASGTPAGHAVEPQPTKP